MEFIKTNDGSYTLYSEQYTQHYHSSFDGALKETIYKHISPAFLHHKNTTILNI